MNDACQRAMIWSGKVAVLAWLVLAVAPAPTLEAGDDAGDGDLLVGVSQVDITPQHPVRLNGFGFRRTESEGVDQRIYAKALAIGQRDPVVIVTVDQCIVTAAITEQIAGRLRDEVALPRERFVLSISHSHTTPMLTGAAPTLFGTPIAPEHQANIDRYTEFFIHRVTQAALEALADRRPATLAWTIGSVGFAANRRTRGGPVDHDLPVLVARSPEGAVRAVLVSYACHCVTLSHNKVTGDWAGYAQARLQEQFPGAIAMTAIGAGADANPSSGVTGDKLAVADEQGLQIAREVARLVQLPLAPLGGRVTARFSRIPLPFDVHPTRQEWEDRARRTDATGHHARTQLARLGRGEKLLDHIDYPVQTFAFDDDLAMIFLGGELVVDYALRLKRELDAARLWVTGYCNDIPGYIPSERILREGSYEGGDAMIYYDLPTRYAPGLEDKIVDEVRRQLGAASPLSKSSRSFLGPDTSRTDGTQPLPPHLAAASIRVKEGLKVELVATEPLVQDPVAIDWAPDGAMFVAEMHDYPLGLEGDPARSGGGVVRRLVDTDGDGRYDRATVFAADLPFPTGVTAYRRGVLICAAPDILYAQDTDGDGVADVRQVLFTGFATHNYQARVNAIRLGLDNWWYVAAGIFGGKVRSFTGQVVDVSNRDFRIRPDTGEVEPVAGQSQHPRVRNDQGDWFGCDSGTLLRHYPLEDRYVRRNPHFAPPSPAVALSAAVPIRPITRKLQLFALSGDNRMPTAACGVEIYRDLILGDEYYGDSFTCEPAYNAVIHQRLGGSGVTFAAARPADETDGEFLASIDSWFRPVEARTGPDGALYIVDMYRFVIEHPIWIPPDRLSQIDVRAGESMGRIYRVVPSSSAEKVADGRLDMLDTPALAAALEHPSGTRRDLVHAMLLWRADAAAVPTLVKLASDSTRPQVRLQAMAVLDGLGAIEPQLLGRALADPDAAVRRHAVRLLESHPLDKTLLSLTADPDARVRLQLACSLGMIDDPRAGESLARLMLKESDPYLMSAVMSSIPRHLAAVTRHVLESEASPDRARAIERLMVQAIGQGDEGLLSPLARRIVESRDLAAAATYLKAARKAGVAGDSAMLARCLSDLAPLLDRARAIATDEGATIPDRRLAVSLLGAGDVTILQSLLTPRTPAPIRDGAVEALLATGDGAAPDLLLAGWAGHAPQLRAAIVQGLLSRPAWTAVLLHAADRDSSILSGLSPAARDQLLHHPQESVRSLARTVLRSAAASRQDVIERYRTVSELKGEAQRGREVFERACASCHPVRGAGNMLGPDLAGITDRSVPGLLVNILDPNRAVMDNYLTYVITMRDGRSVAGVIASETASSVQVKSADGQTHEVLRAQITSQISTGRSLMPEGLEASIDPQSMADLIAYLGGGAAGPYAYTGPVKPAGQYPDSAEQPRLTNGDLGSARFNDGQWVGFQKAGDGSAAQPEILLDLGRSATVESLQIVYGVNHSPGGIHAPRSMQISLSEDGVGFAPPLEFAGFSDVADGLGAFQISRRTASVKIPSAQARYVRLRFFNDGEWTFLSELKVNPSDIGEAPLAGSAPGTPPAAHAVQQIRHWVAAFTPGTPAEYEHIPLIWRTAIEAAKLNEPSIVRSLVEISLPAADGPLHHWQAVVLGGAVINGLSLIDVPPRVRIAELIGDDEAMNQRLARAIELSVAMADDESVPTGTRYDALRVLALGPWERHGAQLLKYLKPGVNEELRMGAWSAISDVPGRPAADALLDAVENGHLTAAQLTGQRTKRLVHHPDPDVRARADRLLGPTRNGQ